MINITEEDLRDILQIEIGGKGVWTYDLEEEIVKRIKDLTIPIVSESLRMEELLLFYSKHKTFNFNSSVVEVLSAIRLDFKK